MSTTQEQIMVIQQEEYYTSWSADLASIASAEEDPVRDKLLDTNVKFLLGLGVIPIIVGIAIGIWPVALTGLGPWLLAWLDTNQRRQKGKR